MNTLELFSAHRAAVARAIVRHMSHELVQPLTALVNYVEVGMTRVEQGSPASDAWRPLLHEMRRHAEDAVASVRQLRVTIDRPAGVQEPVDLNAVVRDAADFMAPVAREHDIRVELRLATLLPTARGDRWQFLQAVVELLRNAFEAIGDVENGRRDVTVYTELSDKESIEVRVQDTGKAVSSEEIERIFQPFFTTKPGSLGLGLAVARAAIEAHGGRILARPNADVGMSFLFRLPTVDRTEHKK